MKSEHFTVGSHILLNNRRGEITSLLSCKCSRSEKALRIRWEDGSLGIVAPFALNRQPLTH